MMICIQSSLSDDCHTPGRKWDALPSVCLSRKRRRDKRRRDTSEEKTLCAEKKSCVNERSNELTRFEKTRENFVEDDYAIAGSSKRTVGTAGVLQKCKYKSTNRPIERTAIRTMVDEENGWRDQPRTVWGIGVLEVVARKSSMAWKCPGMYDNFFQRVSFVRDTWMSKKSTVDALMKVESKIVRGGECDIGKEGIEKRLQTSVVFGATVISETGGRVRSASWSA